MHNRYVGKTERLLQVRNYLFELGAITDNHNKIMTRKITCFRIDKEQKEENLATEQVGVYSVLLFKDKRTVEVEDDFAGHLLHVELGDLPTKRAMRGLMSWLKRDYTAFRKMIQKPEEKRYCTTLDKREWYVTDEHVVSPGYLKRRRDYLESLLNVHDWDLVQMARFPQIPEAVLMGCRVLKGYLIERKESENERTKEHTDDNAPLLTDGRAAAA